MILVKVTPDYAISGFRSGSKSLLERLKTDSDIWVDQLDTSLPMACYRYDPASEMVVLRDNWEDIQRIEESSMFVSAHDLENRLSARKLEIKEQAEALSTAPVEYADGSLFRGGKSSATSIQGAISLAQADGKDSFVIRHADRSPRTTNAAEAMDIALTIARAYEPIFQAEEDALYALDQIDLEAEDALAQINAITLEVSDV